MKPKEFAFRVVELFEKRQSVFQNKISVEDWVPKTLDSFGKSCFLFYVTQLDYAIKSQFLYEGALNLLAVNPQFFSPTNILESL